MRRLAAVLSAAFLALASSGTAIARSDVSRDAGRSAAQTSPYELVVFEANGCVYCDNFRRDVLPLYRESTVSREAPIRFVNLSYADESGMGLAYAVTIAPTVVLMRDGREVDRIIGYTGPFNFLKLVNVMMGRSQ